jgi:SpoVK/Ycf46/Vps4 family AAA+-type ATPase
VIRDYLFDIAKIVDGAANGDYEKVLAYTESLGEKLDSAGERASAKRIRQIVGKSAAKKMSLARAVDHLPVDSESRIPVADEERVLLEDVNVFLSEETQSMVDRFLTYFRAAGRLIANGVGVSPTLLMHGPPGCGKTQLARRIAAELNLPLITARSDALISSYLGSTSKNLRLLFEHAMSRPCILFLDEFDAIAKLRDDDRELGELKRVVISLMQNIDAMGDDHVILAATNHSHLLDPAIWRRFAYKVRIDLPGVSARRLILKNLLGEFADSATIDIAANFSEGMTGSQLKDIVDDAKREAVLANRQIVSARDIAESLAGKASLVDQICAVRSANPKLSQSRIADMFSVSQPYVSKILKKGKDSAA